MTPNHLRNQTTPGSAVNLWLVLFVAALTTALGWQLWKDPNGGQASEKFERRAVTPRGSLADYETSTIRVFENTSPSVVFIRTRGYQRYLFGGVEERELSSGTGFVWDDTGHIVTNLHVIREKILSNSRDLVVQFSDGTLVDAEVVGAVQRHDIAVLKVQSKIDLLQPILLGTSDDLQVGQQVLAIGNPFGFDQTLSTGVIGGLNRSVASEGDERSLDGLIQTDAAINPGNSGGPLLDSSGRLIGVNTAIVSPTGAYSGLGFAVPVSNVISSVEMVLQASTGERPPQLGIQVIDPEILEGSGLSDEEIGRGLFIDKVLSGGPAARIGLRGSRRYGGRVLLGDQITAVDENPVTTIAELRRVLLGYSPGDVVTLSVLRDGRQAVAEVELGTPPELIFE